MFKGVIASAILSLSSKSLNNRSNKEKSSLFPWKDFNTNKNNQFKNSNVVIFTKCTAVSGMNINNAVQL